MDVRDGKGVPKDDAEAVKWYRKAADQGDAIAQFNLGWMYDEGRGVSKDDAEAVRWYRKAADQGHALAQFNLGAMYANGEGVAKDDAEAVKWYRKAADQGDADAQAKLRSYRPGWKSENQELIAASRAISPHLALGRVEEDRRRGRAPLNRSPAGKGRPTTQGAGLCRRRSRSLFSRPPRV